MEGIKKYFLLMLAIIAVLNIAMAEEESMNELRALIVSANTVKIVGVDVDQEVITSVHTTLMYLATNATFRTNPVEGDNIAQIFDMLEGMEHRTVTVIITSDDLYNHAIEIVEEWVSTMAAAGGHADRLTGNNYYAVKLRMGTKKYGALILDENNWEEIIREIVYEQAPEQQDNIAHEREQDKPVILPPPPGTPPEHYVAVPVPRAGTYTFEGNIYHATCAGDFCVILIPKEKIRGKSVDLRGNNVVASPNGGIRVFDAGAATITRIAKEGNKYRVIEYVAKGQHPVAIELNIPKTRGNAPEVITDTVYIETDPVIKMYLQTYGGDIVVDQIAVEKVADVIEETISFESCALHIDNVAIATSETNGFTIFVSFQVLDGDTPVYVPKTKVSIGGTNIVPQYNPVLRTYTASAHAPRGSIRINISTDADGCSAVGYTTEIYSGHGPNWIIHVVIGLVIVAATAVALLRIVWR